MRGFYQLVLTIHGDHMYALIAADAAVPFRTSASITDRYDEAAVLEAIKADIERHGAPLAWRMDRCSAHRTAAVRSYLENQGVELLFGPPRRPHFYGQLERQNREHRSWLAASPCLSRGTVGVTVDTMLASLNGAWPRRALAWKTAADAWASRPPIEAQERFAFRREVYNHLQLLQSEHLHDFDRAMRLAIEQALQQQGYLTITRGSGAI